ncbi:TetR/AcrR family transcriptional regulator [Amycolatopsis sp. OK19-0408]|uniref:TetR/AcrR family transcriptional regulator n=1 Tax=Amycolatopsis iheyensis TaxID=2945988 RepID=A0A9X2NAH3_9PSEU|nr:TetR/AcrR family transcriptional regulator [Amycolatopsis iheyensis]MCR6485039.1 TetR/AcrR family transcriptional regulator [Amycolatopsis iheyensis]
MSAEPPRRRPKDRKQQIVGQAREMFIELGYPNVTMTALAERVGITAGALYRHFSTKNDLLDAVLRDSFAGFDRPLTETALEAAVDEAIDVVTPHPHVADLWDREVRYAEPGLRRKYVDVMRAWAAEFGRVLRAHRGDLDEGTEDLLAWAMQSGLACLGTSTIHAQPANRRTAVRSALLAIASAPVTPTGSSRYAPSAGRTPVSRRERLLLAAATQFATQGYQETSMAGIGAAADVTGPNLYSYFASKAELLRAVYERGTHYLWIGLDAAFARAGQPDEALRLVIASYVEHAREWGSLEVGRSGEREVEAETLGAQREYAAEWIALVQEVVPGLAPPAARLRVQIGLKVINDLLRTPRIARFTSADVNLAAVVHAILTGT